MIDAIESARELAAGNDPVSSTAGGADAAREFEAFLLHQMLKRATQPIGGGHLLDGGSAGRLFRDLFLEEVARLAAADRGLGVAALLEAGAPDAGSSEPTGAQEEKR